MSVVIVTGSSGLVGAESVKRFHEEGLDIIGIDNDLRSLLFGSAASTKSQVEVQMRAYERFTPLDIDIRDEKALTEVFTKFGKEISGIIHCAAQPSHDWAATNPKLDFEVNAVGTLNLLELTRKHCPEAAFIFMSTNKVYGDAPNAIPYVEFDTRYELSEESPFSKDGINESLTIDNSLHSLFGVSKASADLLVQEYGRYFGLKTVAFRGGCLTGPLHQGAEMHGFLSYLVKCVVHRLPYTVFGYEGKQVRDNIHSRDLVEAFWQFFKEPKNGEVYNIGGSRFSNISMLEAILKIEEIAGNQLNYTISKENRKGDHRWYVSDISKFKSDYTNWNLKIDMSQMLAEMVERAEFDFRK
jgi:CDP-paratose 2-epimerase